MSASHEVAVLEPTVEDVTALVDEVWTSFLGAEEPLLAPFPGPEREHGWSAAVTVSGAWSGQVTVEISAAAAVAVTSVMLATEDVGAEDVTDAVGELVNMVGGNVKSLIDGPGQLSLPVVAAGVFSVPSTAVEVCRVDAVWHGEPVRVLVHALPAAGTHPHPDTEEQP
jgi:chemotaxis protein CheX